MKRAADETTQIDETKAKIPKVKAFTASRAEWGVMHAKLDQVENKEEELPNTPIILNCKGEEHNDDFALAYWPKDMATGQKLLSLLDSMLKDDLQGHMSLVEVLHDTAYQYVVSDETKRVRQKMEEAMGKEWLTELGIIVPVQTEGFFAKRVKKVPIRDTGDTDSSSDEDSSEKEEEDEEEEEPKWPVVKMSELSPSLYYHECIAYWY